MNDEFFDEQQSRMARKARLKRREVRSWVLSVIGAFVIALLLRLFVFEFVGVSGPSMEPELYSGEYVLVEKVSYWFGAPAYGDVVICKFPNSTAMYVKRVIGTAGDVLEIRDGVLTINGVPDSAYFDGYINGELPPTTVPEGTVFVMGDNRNESMDSRYDSVGPIPYEMVLGKGMVVVWPPDQIHGLQHAPTTP